MPRAGLNRAAVVDLALAVVDDGEFEGLTLAAVAGRAGVAVPSLYKHVAGLADLRREVALRAVAELVARLRDATEGRRGADAVTAVAHAVRGYAAERPGRYAAVQAAPALGDDPQGRLGAVSAEAVDVIADALRAAGVAGSGDDVVHVVRVVRAAVHGFVDLERRGGFGLPQDRDASFARLVDVLVAGLPITAPRATRAAAPPGGPGRPRGR